MPKSSMLWILVACVFAAFMAALETGNWQWWVAAVAGLAFLLRDKLSLKPVKKVFAAVRKRLKKKRSSPAATPAPTTPKVKKNHIVVKYSKDLEQRRLREQRLAERENQPERADIIDSVAYEEWENPEQPRLPSGTRRVGRNIL